MHTDRTQHITIEEYRRLLARGSKTGTHTGQARARKNPEEDLHRACIEWIFLITPRYPILKWMVHVPNGGKRPKGEAGKLKALGAKPGVPDLLLPRKFGTWTGCAVELKSEQGRLSPDQADWLAAFNEDGYLTKVCRSLEEFQTVVYLYLGVDSAHAKH